MSWRRDWERRLDQVRLSLSHPEAALTQLAIIALLTGILTGLIIISFHLLVDDLQNLLLQGQGTEAYESLPPLYRLLLPMAGAVLLALFFHFFAKGLYVLGVTRVLERMAYYQGRLTLRGLVLQFVGVAIAIISGHSVGREGAHIFLGAATGSLLGQKLDLPINAERTLVACGSAAGIAASFNTPLAGVIFALEVIMMDYHLHSFIPVILSAVSATVLSNLVLGNIAPFSVPMMGLNGLYEIPLVIMLGLICGAIAALFIQMVKRIAAFGRRLSFTRQMMLAGLGSGFLALLAPEIMGMGYDSINLALLGTASASALLTMAAFKLVATSLCSGLNVPGGMIGPAFFIGATLGGGIGQLYAAVLPAQAGVYAMLGMGALMAASLQAPLAALTALLELTDNANIIMPGMLAVVIASLTAKELFKQDSLFLTMLRAKGLDYDQSPVLSALRRIGVGSAMNKQFILSPQIIERQQAQKLLAQKPHWILIYQEEAQQPKYAMPAVYLASFMAENSLDTIDLLNIPAEKYQLSPIHLQASLQEALEQIETTEAQVLYVQRMTAPGIRHIYGVLTAEDIESAYRLR